MLSFSNQIRNKQIQDDGLQHYFLEKVMFTPNVIENVVAQTPSVFTEVVVLAVVCSQLSLLS